MQIREWQFKDILALSELESSCFTSDAWSYRTFAACFENPAFCGVVAEDGDEIVGHAFMLLCMRLKFSFALFALPPSAGRASR